MTLIDRALRVAGVRSASQEGDICVIMAEPGKVFSVVRQLGLTDVGISGMVREYILDDDELGKVRVREWKRS